MIPRCGLFGIAGRSPASASQNKSAAF